MVATSELFDRTAQQGRSHTCRADERDLYGSITLLEGPAPGVLVPDGVLETIGAMSVKSEKQNILKHFEVTQISLTSTALSPTSISSLALHLSPIAGQARSAKSPRP